MTNTRSTAAAVDIDQSAVLLGAMANASRLNILTILSLGEVSVGDLSGRIGMSQSAVSQHLSKLRGANLVTTRQDAQTVYYSCRAESALRVLALLELLFAGGSADNAKHPSQSSV